MIEKNIFNENTLEINVDIKKGIFSRATFFNNNLEKSFMETIDPQNKEFTNCSNFILMSFYIVIFIYSFLFFSKPFLLIGNVIFFLISVLLIIIEKFPCLKFLKKNICFEFVQILLICLNFNFILFTIFSISKDIENESMNSLKRIIPFIHCSTNILIFIKLEGYILFNLFFHGVNSISIFVIESMLNKTPAYYLEIFINILIGFIFFLLRKIWDIKIRESYGREFKYKLLYNFTNEVLKDLNGYNLIIKDGKYICLPNFRKYLWDIIRDKKDISKDGTFTFNKTKDKMLNIVNFNDGKSDKINKNRDNIKFSKENSLYLSKHSCNNLFENAEQINFEILNDNKNYFKKNLGFKFNDNHINLQNNINLNVNIINNETNNNCIHQDKKFCTNFNQIRCKNFVQRENKGEDYVKGENFRQEDIKIFLKQFKKENFLKKNIQESIINNNLIRNESSKNSETLYEILENINEKKNQKHENMNKKQKIISDTEEWNNKTYVKNDTKNKDKKKYSNNKYLGTFKLEKIGFDGIKDIQYFDIVLRKTQTTIDNLIVKNLNFYDVTELVKAKKKILDEKIIKDKIFAKMIHEFKTPLNSLIILIDILKKSYKKNKFFQKQKIVNGINRLKLKNNSCDISMENQEKLNDEFSNSFSLIKSVSNYLTFLISDLITYSNTDQIEQIKVIKTKVYLKSILSFTFKILKTLLYFNKNKLEKIIPEISIDKELENCQINADEYRIKQILLNFISNSVKFTSKGIIKIEAKLVKKNDYDSNKLYREDNRKMYQIYSFHSNKLKIDKNEISSLKSKSSESNINDSIENDFHQIRYIEIKVIDSGMGIKENDQKKIFNDYCKLNNEKENFFGSGLGLSICKTLCDKMNYEVSFSSKFEQGSIFLIKIPENNIELCNNPYHSNVIKKNSNSSNYNQSNMKCNFTTMNSSQRNVVLRSNYIDYNNQNYPSNKISTIILERNSFYKISNQFTSSNQSNNNCGKSLRNHEINLEDSKINNCMKDSLTKLKIKYDIQDCNSDAHTTKKISTINFLYGSNSINSELILKKELSSISKFHDDYNKNNKVENQCFLSVNYKKNISNDIIILADDNHLMIESQRNILNDYLKENNLFYEIILCYDGSDILKQILEEKVQRRIKYIITDENMDSLNGSDVIKIIRFLELKNYIHKIKIISLSSHEDADTINSILQAGADEVIGKPLVKSLIKKIFNN